MVNLPIAIDITIDEGIARLYIAFGACCGIRQGDGPSAKSCRAVAINFDCAAVDRDHWAALQKADEIIVDGRWGGARCVGHSGK